MWVMWALVSLAVLAWLGYSWFAALVTKYEHTRDSAVVFAVLGAASLYCGVRVAAQIAPAWAAGPKSAIVIGVGLTLFAAFSFIAVNLWCSLLTRRFDESIASLEEEEDLILRKLDAMRWKAIRQSEHLLAAKPSGSMPDRQEDEPSVLKRSVEKWEQGGGAARIRSLKVLEWREELSDKSVEALEAEVESLQSEIRSESDEAKREQAKAKMALAKLLILEKSGPKPSDTSAAYGEKPSPSQDEAGLRQRLQEIRAEIQSRRAERSQFLRQRIRLSWRIRE